MIMLVGKKRLDFYNFDFEMIYPPALIRLWRNPPCRGLMLMQVLALILGVESLIAGTHAGVTKREKDKQDP